MYESNYSPHQIWVEQTGLYNLGMVTGKREGKFWMQTYT